MHRTANWLTKFPRTIKLPASLPAPKSYGTNVPIGKVGHVYSSIQEYFPETKRNKYVVLGVHDEGNCFYDTMACALNMGNYFDSTLEQRRSTGIALRKTILKHNTAKSWESFWASQNVGLDAVPPLKTVWKQMDNRKTWADVYSILYTCDRLKINLIVFDVEKGGIYCGTYKYNPSQTTILMAWIGHMHFSPIGEIKDGQTLTTRFVDSDPIMQHINQMYHDGCSLVSVHDILLRRR